MLELDIRSNVKHIERQLNDLVRKQVPFATAQAINAVALKVQAAEREQMMKTFDRPTPFTLNSVAVKRATKVTRTAMVYIKPIAAKYLEPYEDGGTQKTPGTSRATFSPKSDALLNKYGGLPRNAIAKLRGRSDVFVGTVTTRGGGEIDGVWQRPARPALKTRKAGKARGPKRGLQKNTSGRLKLLVRFSDPQPVKTRLPFGETADEIVKRDFAREFDKALDAAVKTAK